MKRFAELIDALVFTPSRNTKIRLMADYFSHTPDPDRGFALAALTGSLSFTDAKPAALRNLVMTRVDPVLYGWSYDFVGDTAETISLIWPPRPGANHQPTLSEVVEALAETRRADVPRLVERWLDALDAQGRYALIKLITGSLRIGVSARLAKTALADWGSQPVDDIEEVWHGLTPPYVPLFAWLEGRGERPAVGEGAGFRPLMLATPLEDDDIAALDAATYRAEWKWDGIRVQLAARGGERRIYSRTGDDVGPAFPEMLDAMAFDAVLDGELLVVRDGVVAPFNDLQQRLNRKAVTAKMLRDYPVHIRLYDILFDGPEDLRALGWADRRKRLEAFVPRLDRERFDLSRLIEAGSFEELEELRGQSRDTAIEGMMLKRRDSPYVAGRRVGLWYKWKRDPLTADCVLMYAQRGSGKRSSYYSDYTFGCWAEGGELLPVGKAYFGFTDEELKWIDRWVRNHTTQRFGPVREVKKELVLEVAFDSIHKSTRHKSGLAMRFPRISRIRTDKPANEADLLATLQGMAT